MFALRTSFFFEYIPSKTNWADAVSRVGFEDPWLHQRGFSCHVACFPFQLVESPFLAVLRVFEFWHYPGVSGFYLQSLEGRAWRVRGWKTVSVRAVLCEGVTLFPVGFFLSGGQISAKGSAFKFARTVLAEISRIQQALQLDFVQVLADKVNDRSRSSVIMPMEVASPSPEAPALSSLQSLAKQAKAGLRASF
eukprot:s2599_g9.t1